MRIEEVHACDPRNLRVVVDDAVYPHTLLPVPDAVKKANIFFYITEIIFKILFKAMFTRDRFQMVPTLSWNGPFLFTRCRSAYQRQSTRDRSVMVRY